MPFVKGQSGNPAGRPVGSRNHKTLLIEAMLEGHGEDLADRLIEKAMSGDPTALKLCFDRLLPRGRDRPVVFPLPLISGPDDVPAAVAEIQAAVYAGALTPREGMDLLRLLDKVADTLARAAAAKARATGVDERAETPARAPAANEEPTAVDEPADTMAKAPAAKAKAKGVDERPERLRFTWPDDVFPPVDMVKQPDGTYRTVAPASPQENNGNNENTTQRGQLP
jgi:hypothetical protein